MKPSAPRFSTSLRGNVAADRLQLALVGEHDVRAQQLEALKELSGSVVAIPAAVARSTLIPPPCAWIGAGRLRRRLLDRAPQERVPGQMEPLAPANQRTSSSSARRNGATPRSVSIVRLPSARDERDDDAVPSVLHRPEHLDPARLDLARSQLAAGSEPRFRRTGLGPELGAHAATFAAWPPAANARLGRAFHSGPAGAVRPDDHVQQEISERADPHSGIVSGGHLECRHGRRRSQVRAPPLDARRRPDRRVRRDRDAREAGAERGHAPPTHASGLAAFEDAPCYQETIEREAADALEPRESPVHGDQVHVRVADVERLADELRRRESARGTASASASAGSAANDQERSEDTRLELRRGDSDNAAGSSAAA